MLRKEKTPFHHRRRDGGTEKRRNKPSWTFLRNDGTFSPQRESSTKPEVN